MGIPGITHITVHMIGRSFEILNVCMVLKNHKPVQAKVKTSLSWQCNWVYIFGHKKLYYMFGG